MPEKKKRVPPVAAHYLNKGESPHQRAEKKRKACLKWIYVWGYTSGKLLTRVSGAKQAIAKKYETAGLIIGTRTEAGGVTRGTPKYFYTLTEAALQEVEHDIGEESELLRYPEIDPYKVDQKLIRHNLLAQDATLNSLEEETIKGYLTERQLNHEGDKPGVKRPDVVWVLPSGELLAIEVELSAKYDQPFSKFLLGIISCLTETPGQGRRFNRVGILTPSKAIKTRYQNAMQPGQFLFLWMRNSQKNWVVSGKQAIPNWLSSRVIFILLEDIW